MPRPLTTTEEWRAAAKVDPLYAVASWPGKRNAWESDEFYEVGASDWEDCEARWRQYDPGLGGHCVEIGCGAGRVTRSLAQSFATVTATDVSDEMLALARDACPSNAELIRVDATEVPLGDASADAAYTAYVLQHLAEPEHVIAYLREIFRVLRPGGTAMIHVALRRERSLHTVRLLAGRSYWWAKRQLSRGGASVVAYTSREYRRAEIRGWLEHVGFADVELREFRLRSNGTVEAFWLTRKPV
jgi:ubiquinone/menaquinone biosynthesis C-methylase UbiE